MTAFREDKKMKNVILALLVMLSTNTWAKISRKEFKLIKDETLQRWDESDYEDKEYHNGETCQVVLTKSWDFFVGSRDVDTMTVELDGKSFTFIFDSVYKLGRKTFRKTSTKGNFKYVLKRTNLDRYNGIRNEMTMMFSAETGQLTDVKLVFKKGEFGTPTNFYTFVEDESLRETVSCNLEW